MNNTQFVNNPSDTDKPPKDSMNSKQLVEFIINTCEDMKADAIKVYDFTQKYYETDYMICCSGLSTTHANSISDKVEFLLKKQNQYPLSIEGRNEQLWILIDYGNVVLHIMETNRRDELDIDTLLEERVTQLRSKQDYSTVYEIPEKNEE